MNQIKEKNKNIISKTLYWIHGWSIEKKRVFAISSAVFLTILIIVLSFSINSIWKDEVKIVPYDQINPIKSIQESFSEIENDAKPVLEQVFGSSTENIASGTEQTTDQNISTSSSVSSSSN